MTRHHWTPSALNRLRRLYPTSTAPAMAISFGCSVRAIYYAVEHYGLKKQARIKIDSDLIRTLNAHGLSDTEIAEQLSCDRHAISRARQALSLPSNARGDRYRRRVTENTQRQCREAGVASLGAVRSLTFRRWSESRGWGPIPPREAMILDALDTLGPLTRQQIAEAIGLAWHGSRSSLKSRGRGSYLANLMARGQVICLGKLNKQRGKGCSTSVYALASTTVREVS